MNMTTVDLNMLYSLLDTFSQEGMALVECDVIMGRIARELVERAKNAEKK